MGAVLHVVVLDGIRYAFQFSIQCHNNNLQIRISNS